MVVEMLVMEVINMKNTIIQEIEQSLLNYLDNSQLDVLHTVLCRCLDKIEIKDEKEESLPLVKKTHKGEDSRTYDDKVQYALEELTEELGLSDYEVNAEESNIIRSRYKDVGISIEYLS